MKKKTSEKQKCRRQERNKKHRINKTIKTKYKIRKEICMQKDEKINADKEKKESIGSWKVKEIANETLWHALIEKK